MRLTASDLGNTFTCAKVNALFCCAPKNSVQSHFPDRSKFRLFWLTLSLVCTLLYFQKLLFSAAKLCCFNFIAAVTHFIIASSVFIVVVAMVQHWFFQISLVRIHLYPWHVLIDIGVEMAILKSLAWMLFLAIHSRLDSVINLINEGEKH